MPPVAWACVILIGTSWPSIPVEVSLTWADKIVHFTLYGVFSALMVRALDRPLNRRRLMVVLLGIWVFGALDELHQIWIPGRTASHLDWLADCLGALTGLLVGRFLPRPSPSRQDLSS
jgi:VanZ family protein